MRALRLLVSHVVVAWCAVALAASPKAVQVKVRVDSDAPSYEGFKALDGDPQTLWHTAFGRAEPKHPHA